jgi:hypothetical protein
MFRPVTLLRLARVLFVAVSTHFSLLGMKGGALARFDAPRPWSWGCHLRANATPRRDITEAQVEDPATEADCHTSKEIRVESALRP